MSAAGAEDAPDWPVFIRASLIGSIYEAKHYQNPAWKLSNYPGPFLYGGPFPQSQYGSVLSQLEQWAFGQKLTTSFGPEPSFFVVAHKILIAPNTGATPWPPKPSFSWRWISESGPSPKHRIVFTGLGGGKVVVV